MLIFTCDSKCQLLSTELLLGHAKKSWEESRGQEEMQWDKEEQHNLGWIYNQEYKATDQG